MANYVTQENLVTYNTQIKTFINDQDKKVVAAAKNYINTAVSGITPATIGAEVEGAANDAQINANAYTDQKIADLVDLAPETMDTLKELSDAIKNNSDAVTAINTAITAKADKSELQTLQANFQAGVDSVYDALVAKGATPDSKSLSDIINCIDNISIVPPLPAGLYDADGNLLAELSVAQIEQDSTGCLIPSSWVA